MFKKPLFLLFFISFLTFLQGESPSNDDRNLATLTKPTNQQLIDMMNERMKQTNRTNSTRPRDDRNLEIERENIEKKNSLRDLDEERFLLTKEQINELIMKNARFNYNMSRNRTGGRDGRNLASLTQKQIIDMILAKRINYNRTGSRDDRNLANERDNFIEEWKRQRQEKQTRNEADKKTPPRDLLDENVLNSERFLLTQSQINELMLKIGRANNYTFYNHNRTRDRDRGMSTIESKSDENRNLANERDNFIEEWKRQRQEKQQSSENTNKKTPPRDLDEDLRDLGIEDKILSRFEKNKKIIEDEAKEKAKRKEKNDKEN